MNNKMKMSVALFFLGISLSAYADTGTTTSVTTTTTTTSAVNETDTRIISDIYAKYKNDSALIGTNITANCQDGIVTLAGVVTAQSQADEAVIAAQSVAGVKDVRSSITVTTNRNTNTPADPLNY